MSTGLLVPPPAAPVAPPARTKRRRRRRFSLNGLAIQLSAFALSSTLVALLVVSGSQAAFVEENEAVTEYVPIGTPEPEDDSPPRRRPAAAPNPPMAPPPEPVAEPAPEPAAEPTPEPTATPAPETPVRMPSTVIELGDTAEGTAMFGSETVLAPGNPSDRCIVVDYSGNTDVEPVRLYAALAAGELAPYLDLAVDIGDARADAFGDCGSFVATGNLYRGTLADFAAAHRGWTTGIETWDPAGDEETRAFRFTVSVQDVAAAEGRSVRFGFSWEARAGS